jgi:predicted transcriptional regulator
MYNIYIMKNSNSAEATPPSTDLVRTQIYLSVAQQERLAALALQTDQSKSSLIRVAIDKWLDDELLGSAGLRARKQRLASLAGVWSHHGAKDGVDVRKLREGWSRRTRG